MRLLTLLTLTMWSNTALANDTGTFTFLGLNQCAPFEGVLYDPLANASILIRCLIFQLMQKTKWTE